MRSCSASTTSRHPACTPPAPHLHPLTHSPSRHTQGFTSTPYFYANFVAYVLGLVATVSVMHFFDAAQPALLYLVPACIGAALLTAAARGELSLLLTYSEEKKEEKADEKKSD